MRAKLSVFILLGVGLVFGLLFGRQAYLSRGLPRAQFENKKIRILTYSTFVGSSGPGHEIVDRFKKEFGCDVEILTAGDAGLLLERLKLAQANLPFDVVIGLDQLLLEEAKTQGEWRPITMDSKNWNSESLSYGVSPFVPFDWSPLTFVYRQGEGDTPHKFTDLVLPRFRGQFALQDPRSSSPGLQFYNWVKQIEGELTGEFLTQLKPNIQSISPSWAFSYGLFKKNQAKFVFSYLTSLAFHWGLEKDHSYQVISFPEGHPIQIEYVAVPASCRECELAEKFVHTMLEPWAQKLIMEKNYMLPVLMGIESGTIFSELPHLKILTGGQLNRKDLSDWDKVFQR